MKKIILIPAFAVVSILANAQTNPAITSWLQNTTIMGRHYVSPNPTPVQDNVAANVQEVAYSGSYAYATTNGIPSYITGPFLDGNPSLATDQNAIFKIPLVPVPNTSGTFTATTGGNIGVFINGVAMFDYRDGVAWNPNTNALCGGPGNPTCPGGMGTTQAWNRDAIPAERGGFDCSKAHPAMGNYHHHQNPSAFSLDHVVLSTVCDLYPSDGLYVINSSQHSPLLGFAYDGYPVYGAYGYLNVDGTGGITRMNSSYQLRNITVRTHHADGTDVADGPAVNATYFLGYFREDYEYIATSPSTPDYLDEHNGRFCVTPEYPAGTYCYFATVDDNWNSAYPYLIGPTFYGTWANRKVSSITESVTIFPPVVTGIGTTPTSEFTVSVYPNPATDFVAVQLGSLLKENVKMELYDITGRCVQTTAVNQGSTISYFDTRTLYAGEYIIRIYTNAEVISKKISVIK